MKKRIKKFIIHPFTKQLIFRFMGVFFVVCIAVAVFLHFTSKPAVAEWFDSNWSFRQRVNIPSHTTLETNVYVTVPSFDATDTSKFQPDCGDLRFTKQNGQLLKYYVVDCDATANVHVFFDSLPAGETNYYMYYGNPSAPNGFESADFTTAATGLGSLSLASEEVGPGPIAYWKFDEGNGQTAHENSNNNNLTLGSSGSSESSDPTWQSTDFCLSGSCLYLDGTDDLASVADSATLSITNSFSFSLWIRPSELTASTLYLLAGKTNGSSIDYALTLYGDEVRMYVGSSSNYKTTNSANLAINKNYLITGVYNSSAQTVTLYVNGIEQPGTVSGTIPSSISNTNYSFYVGNASGGGSTLNLDVAANTDDGFEAYTTWYTNYDAVDYVGDNANDHEITAARFTNVTIPQGTTISSATFSFWGSTYNSPNATTFELKVRGEDIDDANAPSGSNLPTSMTKTTAEAYYTPATWTDDQQHDVDVTSVIQEIINRGGWSSGNDINLILEDKDDTSISAFLSLLEYGSSVSRPMALDITYGASSFSTFKGYIDEVKTYNYARSAIQVKTDTLKSAGEIGGTAVMGQQDTAALNSGLVGYWKMDEASWNGTPGEVTDSSGNNNNGVSHDGAAITTPGKFGNGGVLDGTNDFIEFDDSSSLDLSTAVTIAAWVNPDTPSGGNTVFFRKDGSYELIYVNDGRLVGQTHNCTGVASTSTLPTGTWTHVAWTFNNTTNHLYINGELVASSEETCPLTPNNNAAQIGFHDSVYDGKIDDIRVYNRDLSHREIRNLYNWAPGPIRYWNLDENTGTSASDISGNEKTGTLNTFTNTPWVPSKFGSGLLFDGTSDYLTIPNPELPTTDYTYEAWVNIADDSDETLFSIFNAAGSADEFSLEILNSTYAGRVEVVNNDGTSFRSTNVVNKNVWTHVAVTRSGSTIRIYLNGVQDPTTSSNSNVLDFGSCTLLVGADADNAASSCTSSLGNYFNGRMDELRIYNYARSPGQIIEDMNGGHPLGGSPVGSQVAYWKMDELNGSTLNNDVPNSITTSISGASWNTSSQCKTNGCLFFDGSDDVVTVTNTNAIDLDTNLVSGVSFSAWIYPTGAGEGTGGQIFYKGANTWLRVDTSSGGKLDLEGSLDLTTADATVNAASVVTLNAWNHVAMTYTDDTDDEITLWVNGRAVATSTAGNGTPAITDTANLLLGGTTTNNFAGRIDEFKIYSAELTTEQITIDANANASMNFGTGVASESAQLTDGPGNPPILHWNLDENTGTSTVADKSGNGRTGTLNGIQPVDWKPGKVGSALNFDRINNSVSIADASFLTPTTLSTSIWLNILEASSELGSTQLVYEHENSGTPFEAYSLYFDTDNRLYCKVCNTSNTCAAADSVDPIRKNTWYHTTCTWDGSNVRMYLNSVLKETTALSGSLKNGDGAFAIGAGDGGSGNYINALLDEFKLYDYTLNQTQISYEYNRGGPVAWWKLDECQGSTLNDSSGNGVSGTLTVGGSGTQTAVGTCNTSSTAWGNGATGKFNASLNFDTTDDYVDFGDLSFTEGVGQLSWSLWYNPGSTVTSGGCIFCKRNASTGVAWSITNATTGSSSSRPLTVAIASNASSCCTGFASTNDNLIVANTWHHIVAVYGRQSRNLDIYINGKPVDFSYFNDVPPAVTLSTTTNARLNSYASGASYAGGKIDDVRIYNYPLSASQVSQIMNEGASVRFGP